MPHEPPDSKTTGRTKQGVLRKGGKEGNIIRLSETEIYSCPMARLELAVITVAQRKTKEAMEDDGNAQLSEILRGKESSSKKSRR